MSFEEKRDAAANNWAVKWNPMDTVGWSNAKDNFKTGWGACAKELGWQPKFSALKIGDRVIKYDCQAHEGVIVDLRGDCQVLVKLDIHYANQYYGGWSHYKQIEKLPPANLGAHLNTETKT